MAGSERLRMVAPWLQVNVRTRATEQALDVVEARCLVCDSTAVLEMDPHTCVALALPHAEQCRVPERLRLAHAARWN